jgi:hypothetical protein
MGLLLLDWYDLRLAAYELPLLAIYCAWLLLAISYEPLGYDNW